MEDYSSKRGSDGPFVSRKGSSLALRDTANGKDHNGQFCTRIGCSGRLNSAKAAQINYSAKAKFSRPSTHPIPSSSGKEVVGSSSRTNLAVTNTRKSLADSRKKSSSSVEPDSSENSTVEEEPDVQEHEAPTRKLPKGNRSCSVDVHASKILRTKVGSSSLASSYGDLHQKPILGNPHTLASNACPLHLKSTVQGRHPNLGRNGLRNFRCNSVKDVDSSASSSSSSSVSSSDLNLNQRKDVLKKRVCIGESSSSARGKRTSNSTLEGKCSTPTSTISVSDAIRPRSGPPPIRDNSVSSVRTRRSVTSYSNRSLGTRNNLSLSEARAVVPQIPDHDRSLDLSNSTSPRQFFVEPSLGRPLYSQPRSRSESSRVIRPSNPAGTSNMRSLLNRESFRQYSMDGIGEVLLALERIEQDEELTYEQLLVLETNLFLSGLNLHDQHRDMRLDIDNMSYEELLALEDRMGTVSTAVKDEELPGCVESSIYQLAAPIKSASTRNLGAEMEDIKCSICQEEYADGDELGGVRCEHKYHMKCIHQWLRLKNWCPVCKASVVPTVSASSSASSL